MKTLSLNPDAAEWTPGGGASVFASIAAAAAGGGKLPAAAIAAVVVTGAGAGAAGKQRGLCIQAAPGAAGADDDTSSSLAPTPNGLAELASVLSGAASADGMTFEELMFDNSSRRGSLVGQLEDVQEEEHDDDEEACCTTEGGDGGGGSSEQLPDAPPPPGSSGSGASARSSTVAAGLPPAAAAANSTSTSSTTAPLPIGCPAVGTAAAADAAAAAATAAAAVAKAQRDLLDDAPNVTGAAATDAAAPRLGPQDFDILRVVGQGAFGKVFQVRARATGRVYAMKVMRKERILQKDHSDYVRAERDVLTAVVHPYIVTMRYSFQTPSKLYLVLDFINGGHLFFNLYRQGVFEEDVARLYTAEIVAALTYLHGRGIVHRDLKPENVLLDGEGHVKLTDFGLAKGDMGQHDSRTNSFIGTMEYMAPEIIEGKGHGRAVDWWSTGVLLYEMLAGVPPFRAKSRSQLQSQITGSKPKFPKFISSPALSLLKGLLTRDPAARLGGGPEGGDAVKKHPFFKAVNWAKLEARQLESKFKPGVKCNMSVENFDKIWTEQKPVDSPCGTPTDPKAADAFAGFTYIAPSFVASGMASLALRGSSGTPPAAAAAAAQP